VIEECCKHLVRIGVRYHHGRDLLALLRSLKSAPVKQEGK
jgi:hypothetical protein